MAIRRAIGRERLVVLRGVLDRAARSADISRGSKEHEELAARLLQLADVIPDAERLLEILSVGRPPAVGSNAGRATILGKTAA